MMYSDLMKLTGRLVKEWYNWLRAEGQTGTAGVQGLEG